MNSPTTDDTPDLDGRRAVVTGANSGLGLVCAQALAARGASVVMACRDLVKGRSALDEVRRVARADAQVELAELDLARLASVADFAQWYAEVHPDGLDLMLNNAGIMAPPFSRTADGFERQLGTNHLGHFALTGRLLPFLLQRRGARVVTVSSVAHRTGAIDFDDLQGERNYRRWRRYGQSKLANLMFALELDRRARASGAALISVATHPGYASTNLQVAGPPRREALLMRALERFIGQSAEMGALPLLYAATEPDLPGGVFVGPDGPFEVSGHPRLVEPSHRARDAAVARRLWEESERLTGVSFRFGALAPS